MKFVQLLQLLVLQVWVVLAISYREFQLTENKNGACFLIDTINDEPEFTNLDINILTSQQDLPVVIFKYEDSVNLRNLPNLNQFLNDSYIDGKFNQMLRIGHDGSIVFKINPMSSADDLPESYYNGVIPQNSRYIHHFENRGQYCIYIPKTTNQGKYLIDIEIKNDAIPIDTQIYLQVHKKSFAINVIIIFSIYLFHTIKRINNKLVKNSKNSKNSTTHQSSTSTANITSTTTTTAAAAASFAGNSSSLITLLLLNIFLLINGLYLLIIMAFEFLILTNDNNGYLNSIYSFLCQVIYPLEKSIHNPLFDSLILLICCGYSYKQKIPKKFYILVAIYLSSYLMKFQLLSAQIFIPGDFQTLRIVINDVVYDLFYQSIITATGLSGDVKPRLNTLITPTRFLLVFVSPIASNALFPSSIILGLLTLRSLKKSNENTNPLFYTVYGFLIVYSLILKKYVSEFLLPPYQFDGADNFGEVLTLINDMIASSLVKCCFMRYFDFIFVYLIWSFFSTKPEPVKVEISNAEKKKA